MNHIQTFKNPRDYLGPANTSISQYSEHQARHGSRQKQIHGPNLKELQSKIKNLYEGIQNLKSENQSMNALIRVKNQQIFNLKGQLKNPGKNTGTHDIKTTRQVYYLNGFHLPNSQTSQPISTQMDRAILQIKLLTKQRDDLKLHIEKLEQVSINPTKIPINNHESVKNLSQNLAQAQIINQHAKVIQQYEEHIASMASKLSTVHKLQNQVAHLTQERALILQDFEGMRGQLINRIGYCQHLQNQLRILQQNQRGNNNTDFQNLLNRNAFLEGQVSKLNKLLKQREDKIAQIQIGKSGYVQVTKQAFSSLQSNINNLQQKLNQARQTQIKQTEKATNLQIQINRLNREITQKGLKIEIETERASNLQKQKAQLSQSLNLTKNDLKKLQRKYEDKVFEADKLKNQNEKNKKLAAIGQQSMPVLQNYKIKAKQSQQLAKQLIQQINKLQFNFNNIASQNNKAQHLVKQSKAKWQSYQRIIQKQSQQIFKLNDVCSRRLEQIDANIQKNLNLQTRLRQYSQRHHELSDQIEQYIKQNHYVKAM